MKKINFILSLLAFGTLSLNAQETHMPVTLGLKVGIPITDILSAGNTSAFDNTTLGSFTAHTPRYEFGVSGEFHLPYHLRFEIDGLVKRGGFDSALPLGAGLAYRPTTFNQWEIPGVFKYNVSMGHLRPFIDFGASLRHISTVTQTSFAAAYAVPVISNNSASLYNRNSFGGVAGIGLTFKKGPFELTPEARYTRWANQAFVNGAGLRTNLDQGDVLLGIGF